jgi:hypothetical protein
MTTEFANLKLRLTSQRDRVPPDAIDTVNATIQLLGSLASGILGTGRATMRSVRNPHRKVWGLLFLPCCDVQFPSQSFSVFVFGLS